MLRWGVLIFLLFVSDAGATECVAHRGDSANYLENSFSALKAAYRAGSPAVEFDLHHTIEGQAILMHDKTLQRTATHKPRKRCPLRKPISKLSIEDIENCELKNGEPIPTFKEVLRYFRDKEIQLFIEFKDMPSRSTLEQILRAYKEQASLVRLISFKSNILKKVQRSVLKKLIKSTFKNPYAKISSSSSMVQTLILLPAFLIFLTRLSLDFLIAIPEKLQSIFLQ